MIGGVKLPTISFTVTGAPPYRVTPPHPKEREAQIGRRERLVQAALAALAEAGIREPWMGDVGLSIVFRRDESFGDPLNLLAGTASLLEAIAYLNDRQIVEIHYREEDGTPEQYQVELDLR